MVRVWEWGLLCKISTGATEIRGLALLGTCIHQNFVTRRMPLQSPCIAEISMAVARTSTAPTQACAPPFAWSLSAESDAWSSSRNLGGPSPSANGAYLSIK
jgi:hypothetical protein